MLIIETSESAKKNYFIHNHIIYQNETKSSRHKEISYI